MTLSITFKDINKQEVLTMLITTLSIIVILTLVAVLFNISWLLSLPPFIITIILCFIITVSDLLTRTLPINLIIITTVSFIGLIVKHYHLFTFEKGLHFLRNIIKHILRVILFLIICLYISTAPLPIVNGIFLWLALIAFSACYSFLIYMVWSSAFGRTTSKRKYDLIMVLGAGIFTEQVTPMLADRLNQALAVFNKQDSTCKILVSGGQGLDEPISEALAMQRYLIAHGVPESSIIMESQSTSTYENFSFSKKVITSQFDKSTKMLCITSQFHILRALRFAQQVKLRTDGIGSHTPYHFFDIALIRDFLALMYQYKLLLNIYFAVLFFSAIYILF